MIAIPYGSVRGVWMRPAITMSDVGSSIQIAGDIIVVGGERRVVKWQGTPPDSVEAGAMVVWVRPWASDRSSMTIRVAAGDLRYEIPPLADTNVKEADCAFASVEASRSMNPAGDVKTNFYLPTASRGPNEESVTELCNAKYIKFGDLHFSHFVGARRR